MDKDFLFDQGITAGMRGDTDKAIESFRKVVELDRDYVPALYHLGKAYLKKGDFAAATNTLTSAANKRPYQASIHIDLAQAYLCQNELQQAHTEYTKALALDEGNTKAITGLAQVYLKREEWERAASHAKLVLLNSPMNFAALFIFGVANHRLEHIVEAREALGKASDIANEFINLKPDQVEGHYLLGEINRRQDMLDKAAESYELAEKNAGDALIFFAFGLTFSFTDLQSRLGLCYKLLGKVDKAREMGKKILEREPDNESGRDLMQERPEQD
ncbi:MAG: tetratricopeptide repeat protein [Candidatus Hydrogenedentes bacterium]|nr:tetratricopeptide repeat protein [Candidatus Hydrogenedentota bacterium]